MTYPNTLMAKYQAEFKDVGHKNEPVQRAETELDKLREDLAKARKEKRQLKELVGIYAVMIEQLAGERAVAITERDEAIAARDAALGVTVLNPPPQRSASAGRTHRPLPSRGKR